MASRTYWLKVCPFCGSGDVYVEEMGSPHHVYCAECSASVTSLKLAEEGEEDAVNKWNTRAKDRYFDIPLIVRVLHNDVSVEE